MHNFLFSSEQDLASFLKNKKFKKIFILCGKKSYVSSGAKKILSLCLKNKIIKHFFKCSPYPEISELKKIIISLIIGSKTSTAAQQFCSRSMPVRITFRRASFVEMMWIFATGRASLKQMAFVNSQDFTVQQFSR